MLSTFFHPIIGEKIHSKMEKKRGKQEVMSDSSDSPMSQVRS